MKKLIIQNSVFCTQICQLHKEVICSSTLCECLTQNVSIGVNAMCVRVEQMLKIRILEGTEKFPTFKTKKLTSNSKKLSILPKSWDFFEFLTQNFQVLY